MTRRFLYRQPSRRPVVWALAAAFCIMFLLLTLSGAQLIFYVPAAIGASMVLFMLVRNPVNGLLIEDGQLVLSAWRKPRRIPLRDIALVEIIEWSDSTDMKIHLGSGDVIDAFSGDIPPIDDFKAVLAQSGIALTVH